MDFGVSIKGLNGQYILERQINRLGFRARMRKFFWATGGQSASGADLRMGNRASVYLIFKKLHICGMTDLRKQTLLKLRSARNRKEER